MVVQNDTYSECSRKDCQLNNKGKCFAIKQTAKMRNGTVHELDLEHCPFYKRKEKK